MSKSEPIIRAYIKREKAAGKSDYEIVVGATRLPGAAGRDVNKFMDTIQAQGGKPTQEFSAYFGLNATPPKTKAAAKPKAKPKPKPTILDKAKSTAHSVALGAGEGLGNITRTYQGANDVIAKGVNAVVGRKLLPDNNVAKLDKAFSDLNKQDEQLRGQAGYSGVNLGKLGGDIAVKIPLYATVGAPSAGAAGAAAFVGRNAAAGALDGMSRHATSAEKTLTNTAVGTVGGAIGGAASLGIGKVVDTGGKAIIRKQAATAARAPDAAKKIVDNAIKEVGHKVPASERNKMIIKVTQQLKKGRDVDVKAALNKNLLNRYGVNGTQGQITQDAGLITSERELAKLNPELNKVLADNSKQVKQIASKIADDTGSQNLNNNARMTDMFGNLRASDKQVKSVVTANYEAARNTAGVGTRVSKRSVAKKIQLGLKGADLDMEVQPQVKQLLKRFDDPNYTLTIAHAEQSIKNINKTLKRAIGTPEGEALGIAKRALEDELERTGVRVLATGSPAAKDTVKAYQVAKASHAARMQTIDATPALKAALQDAAPEQQAFEKFVIRAPTRDVARLVSELNKTAAGKQDLANMRGATIDYIMTKSSVANDGSISPAAMNRAIKSINPERMKALFTPAQITEINNLKAVTDKLLQDPIGASVNHSNTSSALIRAVTKLLNVVSMIPGAGTVGNVAKGAVGIAGDAASRGTSYAGTVGKPAITKGSIAGLSPQQLKMLGLAGTASRATTAAATTEGAIKSTVNQKDK